jgi:hypothetical protein
MRTFFTVAIAVLALAGAPARAESAFPVDLGARIGAGIPFGNVSAYGGQVSAMSDSAKWMLPIQIEAAYRFMPQLSAGLYLSYAPYVSIASKSCPSGASCSGANWRLGAEAFYKFKGQTSFQPWVGLGIGMEWASMDRSQGGASDTTKLSGWEYLVFQGGLEWPVMPGLTVGPFASLSIGQYGDYEYSVGGGGTSTGTFGSTETRVHEWFFIGVKGTYGL